VDSKQAVRIAINERARPQLELLLQCRYRVENRRSILRQPNPPGQPARKAAVTPSVLLVARSFAVLRPDQSLEELQMTPVVCPQRLADTRSLQP
jgi:hypothetical protein